MSDATDASLIENLNQTVRAQSALIRLKDDAIRNLQASSLTSDALVESLTASLMSAQTSLREHREKNQSYKRRIAQLTEVCEAQSAKLEGTSSTAKKAKKRKSDGVSGEKKKLTCLPRSQHEYVPSSGDDDDDDDVGGCVRASSSPPGATTKQKATKALGSIDPNAEKKKKKKKKLNDDKARPSKYEPVVRGKDARADMKSYACDKCQEWYDNLDPNHFSPNTKKRIMNLSRHKCVHAPPPSTPPHFWSMLSLPPRRDRRVVVMLSKIVYINFIPLERRGSVVAVVDVVVRRVVRARVRRVLGFRVGRISKNLLLELLLLLDRQLDVVDRQVAQVLVMIQFLKIAVLFQLLLQQLLSHVFFVFKINRGDRPTSLLGETLQNGVHRRSDILVGRV